MAQNDTPFRDAELEAAFAEGEPAAGMDLEGAEEREEGAADNPAEEAAEGEGAEVEGTPAVVVVVAEEGEGKEVQPSAAVPATPTEGEEEAAEQAAGKTKPAGDQRADQLAKAVTTEAGEPQDPYDLSDVPAEDQQRAKSWQGRLKKMEEELKAKLAAVSQEPAKAAPGAQQAADAIQQASDQAAASGDAAQAQAVADVAQQVKDGEITPQEAMAILEEDFGPDFVKMVATVAKSVVKPAPAAPTQELEQTKAELQALRDDATRNHFETIADAHPDFVQIYEDPAFRKWATDNGKDPVVERGSARAINKMLDEYKKTAAKPAEAAPAQDAVKAAAKAAPAKVDQAALDAAEGVHGGAVRLPEKPGRADDDFAAAFEKF